MKLTLLLSNSENRQRLKNCGPTSSFPCCSSDGSFIWLWSCKVIITELHQNVFKWLPPGHSIYYRQCVGTSVDHNRANMGTHQPITKLEMIQLIALLYFSYFFLTGCVSRKAFGPLSIHVLKFGSGYPLMKLLKRGSSVAILSQIKDRKGLLRT